MRRHTTVRIAIYALTLQAALSLVSVSTYLVGYWGEWGQVFAAYPTRQRWLWLASLLWSVAAFASGAALLRRRAWGRMLYASAAVVVVIAYFVLLPWPLALSAVPMLALTGGILLSRLGSRYLEDMPVASAVPGKRIVFANICLVLPAIVFTISFQSIVLRLGWMAELPRPSICLLVSFFSLVLAAFASPKGTRAWRFGVGLAVPVVVIGATLLGYLPYAPSFVQSLGPGYREYFIDEGGNLFLILFGILAVVVLRKSRVKPARQPLTWPDQY
ncbi:hypothetical protein LBW59_13610 [Ralstonia solanacearum]|uniref:Transmembrane protein n=1 Tax=Ralstonia solanacearum TaxID=305 RepID=A0AAW5ZP34_RALSL|nr:hypothetical protein [Ralstonia solanacearum]MDB0571801.1 hypothetical protein [Ralstonia solanacearum]